MGPIELDQPLQAEALREIECSLYGKLRAHHLSEAFIERCGEDALQKGLIEYFRAVKDGRQIDNRDAFVVKAAFCRAIDELRREARRSDGATVDAILDSGRMASPPTEEVAVEYLEAEELRGALKSLSPEEQQVLSLHYFDELTAEDSAQALFCSERTYRRRLKQALRRLGQLLDAPVPEPGSELAIEIGVVLWVGLRGAKVVLSQGALEQIVGAADAARDGVLWLGGRVRDLVARMIGGGASEKIAAVASGPAGKAAGVCVAACLLTAGGVELIGVGGGPHHGDRSPVHQVAKQPPTSAVVPAPPVPRPEATSKSTDSPARAKRTPAPRSQASRAQKHEREATEVVTSQQPESAVEAAPEPAPESSSAPSSSSSSSASPTEVASQQFGP